MNLRRRQPSEYSRDYEEELKTFAELELSRSLQKAIADETYTTPTPIQAKTIPPALNGNDILGSAQTGTGKTAAFALPVLNHLVRNSHKPQRNRPSVLVLAPTRELAIQIKDSFATYGKHVRFRQTLVYGGVGQMRQVRALQKGVHVVVATPGRLLDLMNQGHIHLDALKILVLDEADRMLDMGFLPDIKRIVSELPQRRQSLFFSATLPPKIVELASTLLRDPVRVNVVPKKTSVEKIKQQLMIVEREGKLPLLQSILGGDDVDLALVFSRTKRGASKLAERLVKRGLQATAIHGDKSQGARQRALQDLRRRKARILVATDVAARGIDVEGITHVVNYDLPDEPEAYVHRIGRTGRAGADGVAISFCSSGQKRELRAIEAFIGQRIELAPGHVSPFKDSFRSGRIKNKRNGKSRSQEERWFASSNKSKRRKPKPQATQSKEAVPQKTRAKAAMPKPARSQQTNGANGTALPPSKSKPKATKPKRRNGIVGRAKAAALERRGANGSANNAAIEIEAPKKKKRRKQRKGKNERMRERAAKKLAHSSI